MSGDIITDVQLFDEYIGHYKDLIDTPQIFNLCGILVATSSLLSPEVRVARVDSTVTSNLWVMMVGYSSYSRKTTAQNRAWEVIPEGVIHRCPEDTTPEKLIDIMANSNRLLLMKDEITGMFDKSSKDYMKGFKELLLEAYDGFPSGYVKETKSERIEIRNVYLVVLGGTTISRMVRVMTVDDIENGLLPRFLMAFATIENYKEPIPLDTNELYFRTQMQNRLRTIVKHMIRNKFMHISNDDWTCYQDTCRTLYERSRHDTKMMMPFYSRGETYILKIAMLIAASDRRNIITSDDIQRAYNIYNCFIPHYRTICNEICDSGTVSKDWEEEKRVLEVIKAYGEDGIIKSLLLRKCRTIRADKMDVILQSLKAKGEVEISIVRGERKMIHKIVYTGA